MDVAEVFVVEFDVDSPISEEALARIGAIKEMKDARYLDRIP